MIQINTANKRLSLDFEGSFNLVFILFSESTLKLTNIDHIPLLIQKEEWEKWSINLPVDKEAIYILYTAFKALSVIFFNSPEISMKLTNV